jgi:epoxyqueuosine reductase QueG
MPQVHEKIMTANEIKRAALEVGADSSGIAPIDSFYSAPKGFHPRDIYSECQSVLEFAKKLPSEYWEPERSLHGQYCLCGMPANWPDWG